MLEDIGQVRILSLVARFQTDLERIHLLVCVCVSMCDNNSEKYITKLFVFGWPPANTNITAFNVCQPPQRNSLGNRERHGRNHASGRSEAG